MHLRACTADKFHPTENECDMLIHEPESDIKSFPMSCYDGTWDDISWTLTRSHDPSRSTAFIASPCVQGAWRCKCTSRPCLALRWHQWSTSACAGSERSAHLLPWPVRWRVLHGHVCHRSDRVYCILISFHSERYEKNITICLKDETGLSQHTLLGSIHISLVSLRSLGRYFWSK